jgi:hypothetical protein|tara:strand:+ start:730 stop:1107 length:378 start_codon:yes stop_codon:yes gene_type:complete
MKQFIFISYFLLLFSCKNGKPLNVESFRTGTFEIPADDNKSFGKTSFTRLGNLQIEQYGERTDSLFIEWKDNFNYTLKMLHPKSALDKEPIRVRITGVKANSYNFEAIVGHSNFKQKGTVYKISD